MIQQYLYIFLTIYLIITPFSLATTTESSLNTSSEKTTGSEALTSTEKESASTTISYTTSTEKKSSTSTTTNPSTTTSTTPKQPSTTPKQPSTTTSTTTTTTTSVPQSSTEWQDIEETESQKLVNFVVSEIQKLKMEHKELDECQELELSSVLSGKKLNGKSIKYSVTLKVQPQVKNTEECLQQNSTMANMHPEICEADVTEGDRGGTDGKTLLRSTCLQVEELQD